MKYLLYYFLRISLAVVIRIFYRRIHLFGEERIPSGGPVILTPVHPNSFLDGVMLMYLIRRQILSMARGDAFLHPRSNRVLRSMGLLPIFRATDADPRESVRRNNEAFDETYALLQKGLAIVIFPEAVASPEKRVRPLRKGAARLAVDMVRRSGFQMDLKVVPVGMNYTFFRGPRKDLMIQIGEPISILERRDEIEKGEARFVNDLTRELENSLNDLVISAPAGRDVELDSALEIMRCTFPPNPLVQFDRSEKQFLLEKKAGRNFSEKESIPELTEYIRLRDGYGLQEFERYSKSTRIFHGVYFFTTFLPTAIMGFTHGWTLTLARWLTPRKLKQELFYDSLFVGILMIGLHLIALLLFPLSFLFYSWGGVLIYWALRWLLPVYYQNREFYANFRKRRAWLRLSRQEPETFSVLETRRHALTQILLQQTPNPV